MSIPVSTTGLVYYSDPGDPASFSGTGTLIYDISGNNNTGTINGSYIYTAVTSGVNSPEIVVLRYTTGVTGNLTAGDAIYSQTSKVTATVSNGSSSIVTFIFPGRTNIPKSITFYGQNTTSNNFAIKSPVGTASSVIAGGGTVDTPSLISGFGTVNVLTLTCDPAATGAVGTSTTRAYAMVVFGF